MGLGPASLCLGWPLDRVQLTVDGDFGRARDPRWPIHLGVVHLSVVVGTEYQDIPGGVGSSLAHGYYVMAFVIVRLPVALPKSEVADLAVGTSITGRTFLYAPVTDDARNNLDMPTQIQSDSRPVLDDGLRGRPKIREELVLRGRQLLIPLNDRIEQRELPVRLLDARLGVDARQRNSEALRLKTTAVCA